MSEETEAGVRAEYRKKRVRRIKRCIVFLRTTVILLPIVLSICLLIQVQSLGGILKNISAQVDRLTWEADRLAQEADRQQTLLSLLTEKLQVLEERADQADRLLSELRISEKESGEQPETQPPKETAEVNAAHKVYLTFDDGPSIYTNDILDILDEYGVKATFFVLGKESDSDKEALRRIVEDGHTLGMHSYTHRYGEIYASLESFSGDFHKIQDYLYEVTGVKSTVYRFPGGSSNTVSPQPMKIYAEYLNEQGVVFFDWNSASGDGGSELLSADTLLENSLRRIDRYDTFVILLHDAASRPTTVEMLPRLIESILAMEDTVILPITEQTRPIQHIVWNEDTEE